MTNPGTTTTTNRGADGAITTTQMVDASPETQAQTIAGTGSGALGAVLGAANFVYSIIKDHGAKLSVAVETGGDGVSSGTFDDAKFKTEMAGEFTASGIWYTHTRAYGGLLDKHRTDMPHETTHQGGDFGSAYLCTVFPYQLRWNLYKVLPKPISDTDAARKRVEFAKMESEAYDAYSERVDGYKIKEGSLVVGSGRKAIKFRLKDERENFYDYVDFVKQFKRKEPRLGTAIAELEATIELVKQSRNEYVDTVAKSKKTDEPFYVMRNVTVQALTQHQGVRQRFWQHLSINSKFTVTPRKEKPYGFRVGLVWGETALGYGYPGVAGDFEIVQTGPAPGDVAITGSSKLGRRFIQFKEVTKER
jgi:hypothetical protein